MHGNGLKWEDIDSLLDFLSMLQLGYFSNGVATLTSQAAQPELVDLAEGVRVLPIVLDDINVVRGCEDPSKCGGMRIP